MISKSGTILNMDISKTDDFLRFFLQAGAQYMIDVGISIIFCIFGMLCVALNPVKSKTVALRTPFYWFIH